MITIEKLIEFGADTKSGLERCVNNEALYLRLVNMVPGNPSFDKLDEAIRNKDLDAAFSNAHSLKGILANLSITSLLNPVLEITEALREKKDIDYSSLVKEILEKRNKLKELCE